MALTNSRERYRVMRGAGTLVKHLFKKHGAPQEASTYAAAAKPRAASSHSHSAQESLGEAKAAVKSVQAEAAVKA